LHTNKPLLKTVRITSRGGTLDYTNRRGIRAISVFLITTGGGLLIYLGGLTVIALSTWQSPPLHLMRIFLIIAVLGVPIIILGYNVWNINYSAWIRSILGILPCRFLLEGILSIYLDPFIDGVIIAILFIIVSFWLFVYSIKMQNEFTQQPRTDSKLFEGGNPF
jgi:hypothetical protein